MHINKNILTKQRIRYKIYMIKTGEYKYKFKSYI
ncbi:MAG: hypothetical protein BWY32_03647 [bacterium ADurb.Bin243]|nr:MAG: hypothetical protein BWY32_03647 [bacterium ADurb.Bin243]